MAALSSAVPSLTGDSLPIIPTDFFDDGGGPGDAVADSVDSFDLTDLAAAFGLEL